MIEKITPIALAARTRCSLPGLNYFSYICALAFVCFSALFISPVPFLMLHWGDYGSKSPARPPLTTVIYRQKRFLSKRSLFMGCIDVRKGIFNTLLTTLWQSMQSCTNESHSIKIYPRDHQQLGCVTLPLPPLATPLGFRVTIQCILVPKFVKIITYPILSFS